MALAEHLGLSSLTPDEWAAIAKERGMPASETPDLFRRTLADGTPAPAAADVAEVEEEDIDEQLKRLGALTRRGWPRRSMNVSQRRERRVAAFNCKAAVQTREQTVRSYF